MYNKEFVFKNAFISKQYRNRKAIININETKFMGVKKMNGEINFIDNSRSVFEIGSNTKVFTATLLAGFVIENKMQEDDEITNHLPFNIPAALKITLRQLAIIHQDYQDYCKYLFNK